MDPRLQPAQAVSISGWRTTVLTRTGGLIADAILQARDQVHSR
jgi:hypothetical protein